MWLLPTPFSFIFSDCSFSFFLSHLPLSLVFFRFALIRQFVSITLIFPLLSTPPVSGLFLLVSVPPSYTLDPLSLSSSLPPPPLLVLFRFFPPLSSLYLFLPLSPSFLLSFSHPLFSILSYCAWSPSTQQRLSFCLLLVSYRLVHSCISAIAQRWLVGTWHDDAKLGSFVHSST